MPTSLDPPKPGTDAYHWWEAGARAEAQCRTEGRSRAGLDVRDFVDAIAEHHRDLDKPCIAAFVFHVYTAGLPLRTRLRLALKGPRW